MEKLQNKIYAKQNDRITLCNMSFDPEALINLRNTYYNKYGEIMQFEILEGKDNAINLFVDKNNDYYAVLTKIGKMTNSRMQTYYKPNALAEFVLYLAFPTQPKVSSALHLAHHNALQTYISLEQFDLNNQNADKRTKGINIYAAKDFLNKHDYPHDTLNTLQSTLWLGSIMDYKPETDAENWLKAGIMNALTINQEKLAQEDFELSCNTFFKNNVLKYCVNLLKCANDSKTVIEPGELDISKTNNAKSIIIQNLPNLNSTHSVNQPVKC